IICGNHDSFFRDTLETNSLDEFIVNNSFGGKATTDDVFNVHLDVAELRDFNMIVIPWLTKHNKERILSQVASSQMKYAAGHLELNGFNFSKVQTATHGDDPSNFKRFEKVFS